MVKVPAKDKRSIETELKRFLPVFSNLMAKGKASSEDDARIIINDVLSYVLGYDKYNELKTEQRDRNGRLDYLVTLNDSGKRKKSKGDFVIEAKAPHIELSKSHINQTLSYCLTAGLDYFVLTNVIDWHLYKVKRSKKQPDALRIYDVSFRSDNSAQSLAEDFYVFSKSCYLAGDWNNISLHKNATNEADIVAILLSDNFSKRVAKELEGIHGTKVNPDIVRDVIENKIIRGDAPDLNKSLLRKLNAPKKQTKRAKAAPEAHLEVPLAEMAPIAVESEKTG